MALRSVIDIGVNAGEFDAFLKKWEAFQKQAAAGAGMAFVMPGGGAGGGGGGGGRGPGIPIGPDNEAGQGGGGGRPVGASGGRSFGTRGGFGDVRWNNGNLRAIKEVSEQHERGTRATEKAAKHWLSIKDSAANVAKSVRDFASRILHLGGLMGLLGGLATGFGFLGMDRMGRSASAWRREAMGLGASIGTNRSFGLNFGRFVDPSIVGGVSGAMHDITKRVALTSMGMNPSADADAAEVTVDWLDRVRKLARTTPQGQLGQILESRQLGQAGLTLEDLMRMRATDDKEWNERKGAFGRDSKALNLTKDESKAWQDFSTQIELAGRAIETTFIRGLTPLTPKLTELMAAVTDVIAAFLARPELKGWIESATKAIGEFAIYVGSDKFKSDVSTFVTGVEELATKIVSGLRMLGVIPSEGGGESRGIVQTGKDIATGAVIGGIAGGVPGAIVGGIGGYEAGRVDQGLTGWRKNHPGWDRFLFGNPFTDWFGNGPAPVEKYEPYSLVPRAPGAPPSSGMRSSNDNTPAGRFASAGGNDPFPAYSAERSRWGEGSDARALWMMRHLQSDLGISSAQAAAITSAMAHESNLNPEATGRDGDYGLIQATQGRKTAIFDLASRTGRSPRDPMVQYEHTIGEWKNNPQFRALLEQTQGMTDPVQIARALDTYETGAGGSTEQTKGYHSGRAARFHAMMLEYLKQHGGATAPATGGPGATAAPSAGAPGGVTVTIRNQTGGQVHTTLGQVAG